MAINTTGFPNASNTGVPPGVTLTPSGGLVINTPGAVISGLDIKGMVTINAPNVTLQNCKITSDSYMVVKIGDGITGTVVQNCSIDNLNAGGIGISGQGKFLANDIQHCADGINVAGDNTLIQGNYIHDMGGTAGSHFDSIQADGGFSNLSIINNTVLNEYGQTGALMLDNYWGPIDKVVIDGNLFYGGGYTIYINEMGSGQPGGGPITNVSFTNNTVGGGYWGDFNLRSDLGHKPVMSGNISYSTGQLLPGQSPGGGTGGGGTTAPSAPTITSFSDHNGTVGDHITNDNTLILKGSAVANSTVKVFDGATQIGTTTANSNGSWTYTTTALSDGNHNFTAKATTASGTSSASSALAVTIDTKAPNAPTMATPTTNANGSLSLTGTAEANSVVKVFDGTTEIGSATANSSGVWSYKTAVLTTGSHSLTAKATDAAGNVSVASKPVAVDITGSGGNTPAAPKIVSYSDESGGVVGDGITNHNTITLKGTAVANSTVKVFDGTTQIGTAKVDANGAWNYTTAALSDGDHSLTAKVTDAAGHTSAASSALSLKIDTTAPTAPTFGSFSTDGKVVTDGIAHVDHVTLTGTAEANSTVKIFDGTTQIGTAKVDANGAWNYLAGNLTDGNHSFTSKAMDVAGNTSTASTALNVNVDTHTTTPPTSSAEFTNAYQKWHGTVVFKGTADPYSQIKIYDNDGTKAIGTAKTGADGTWSLSTSSKISDKVAHEFTMKVTDTAGHTSAGSGSLFLGTSGSDRLVSTSGDDVFKGNGGKDTFVFAPNFGHDVITDFRASGRSHDVVEFSKNVFNDFASVLSHASQSGRDVVIDAGGGNTLTLKDTKLASLDKTDFHFA